MNAAHAGPLRADPGDRLVIRGHRVGEPARDAKILEVLGENGAPPYVVRWEDNGHVSRFYPSSDAYVHHFEHAEAPAEQKTEQEVGSLADEWEAATPPTDS